jgi:hypothetical protein
MTRSTPDVEAYVKAMEKSTARFCVVKSIELYRYLESKDGPWSVCGAMWLRKGKIKTGRKNLDGQAEHALTMSSASFFE